MSATVPLSTFPPGPFPPLPSELVHQILTTTASSSKPSCLTISLLASWARDLVLPILWHDVRIVSCTQAESIVALRSKEKDKNPLELIKRLWIDLHIAESPVVGPAFDASFFAKCGSLRDVTCPVFLLPALSSLPFISSGSTMLQNEFHLTLLGNPDQGNPFHHPRHEIASPPSRTAELPSILRHITHLHLVTHGLVFTFAAPSILTHLSSLTHLAIPFSQHRTLITRGTEEMIRAGTGLEMVVLTLRVGQLPGVNWSGSSSVPGRIPTGRKNSVRTQAKNFGGALGSRAKVCFTEFEPTSFEAGWEDAGWNVWDEATRREEEERKEEEQAARVMDLRTEGRWGQGAGTATERCIEVVASA